MAVIDRVKWDGSPTELVWKFPSQELSTWTQLIVNESQDAFLVKGGIYEGPFGAGRHTLSTENLPLLRTLISVPFGGRSPFSAEVWYVNKVHNLDIKWGTPDPIQLQDPRFGIMIPVRAFGQYGVNIVDSKSFLLKLIGTSNRIDVGFVAKYLNGNLIQTIKTAIADEIIANGVSIFDISRDLAKISAIIRSVISETAAQYGVSIPQFNIHSINVPDDDPAVVKLRDALATRAEMELLNTNYQQMRSLDVLQTAAGNEGTGGSLMAAGLGAGLGLGVGANVGGVMSNFAPSTPPMAAPSPRDALQSLPYEERLNLISRLAQMRDQGILTEEEFQGQKSKLIGA